MANPTTILFTSLFLILFHPFSLAINQPTYNIVELGANPNGEIDSTRSITKAWSLACASSVRPTVYVPQGRFLVEHLHFKGPCKNGGVTFRVDGTLVAPSDYRAIGDPTNWLLFERADGISIRGGVLDGRGSALWECKKNRGNCPSGVTVRKLMIIISVFQILVVVIFFISFSIERELFRMWAWNLWRVINKLL